MMDKSAAELDQALVAIDGDAPAYGLMEHHIHV